MDPQKTLAQRVLDIARSQVGVVEATNRNDGVPSMRFMGGREEPWCAHFVAWCYRAAGTPLPGDVMPSKLRHNPIARVQTMDDMLRERRWVVALPSPGAIALFRSRDGSDKGDGRHCGIVETVNAHTVTTIEANRSDGVRRVTYPFQRIVGLVTGFGHPPGLDIISSDFVIR